MLSLERAPLLRWLSAALTLSLCTVVLAGPFAAPARADVGPLPRSLPAAGRRKRLRRRHGRGRQGRVRRGRVRHARRDRVGDERRRLGDGQGRRSHRGTTSPDLTASWFEGQYRAMLAVAGALALLMLMLAVIQSVIRQDVWMLVRAAFGYLPMAFILAGVAIAATGLLVAITDDLSRVVVSGLGTEQSDNLLQVGRRRLQERARRELGRSRCSASSSARSSSRSEPSCSGSR